MSECRPDDVTVASAPRDERFRKKDKPDDQRSRFQRDRDRVLYTSAFRRLAGITQVISPTDRTLVHNRLTHTLEVAQIARRLAEKLFDDLVAEGGDPLLDGPNADVAEAAALAHDLGHPPFGHVTEEVLDELAIEAKVLDGFNGNAQSFRIVTTLAVRHQDFPGLNLTRATLDAILKYPWRRQPSGKGRYKWGVYSSELAEFHRVRQGYPSGSEERSIEAEIMDWADDIAYAIHDMEDFYRAGIIPLDVLITNPTERDRFLDGAAMRLDRIGSPYSRSELEGAFRDVIAPSPSTSPFRGGSAQRAALRSYSSFLIGWFVHSASLTTTDSGKPGVSVDPSAQLRVTLLKQLTWQYVIESPALATVQHGQRAMIRGLFGIFSNEALRSGGDYLIFPEYYREQLRDAKDDSQRVRLVIDLIASMTEPQAIGLHRRLTGVATDAEMDWA